MKGIQGVLICLSPSATRITMSIHVIHELTTLVAWPIFAIFVTVHSVKDSIHMAAPPCGSHDTIGLYRL